MGSLCLKGHTQDNMTAATHADAVQTELQTVSSMQETASKVISDKHRTDAGETEPSGVFVVESQPANSSAGDTVPSASCGDTSCGDAGIFAESDQSRSRHNCKGSASSVATPHDADELVNPSTES